MGPKTVAITLSILMALPATEAAAAKCYEDIDVPASLSCASSDSMSADFANKCTIQTATTKKVEVECKGTWVNITHSVPDQTRAQVCATKGMTPTDINGQVCASGERRASGGAGAVSYRFGTWGSVATGGTNIVNRVVAGPQRGNTFSYYYCYGNGQKQDMDSTDMVVAYACK